MALIKDNGTIDLPELYKSLQPIYEQEAVITSLFEKITAPQGVVKFPVLDTTKTTVRKNYDIKNGNPPEQLSNNYITISATEDSYINVLIDKHELMGMSTISEDLMMRKMDIAIKDKAKSDEDLAISVIEKNGTPTDLSAPTEDTIYSNLSKEIGKLFKLGFHKNNIIVVLSVDAETMLMDNARFANSAGALGAELIRKGVVGTIRGVNTITAPMFNDFNYLVCVPAGAKSIECIVEDIDSKKVNQIDRIGQYHLFGRWSYNIGLINPELFIYSKK